MTVSDETRLNELDDEIQEIVRVYSAGSEQMTSGQVARLGLALADLTRLLPTLSSPSTRDYFVMVESLARGTLSALLMKEKHEC
jgi:hypothetical protein